MKVRGALALGVQVCITVAATVGFSSMASAQRANRYLVDVGVGQVDWLSPDSWGTSIATQARLADVRRVGLIAGVRGTFNLFTRGNGLTRRDNVLTASAGLETRIVAGEYGAVFAGVSGAYSRYTSRYAGPAAPLVSNGPVSGNTWPSAIFSLRADIARRDALGLSIRGDIRPRSGERRTLNPTVGVGLTF